MQCFRAAVQYINGAAQLPTAPCAVQPPPARQSSSVMTSGQLGRASSTAPVVEDHLTKPDSPSAAKRVRLAATTSAGRHWSAVEPGDWQMTDDCVGRDSKCPLVQWSAHPNTSSTAYPAAVWIPMLRTTAGLTTTTASALDVSDQPQDLSVRTGARRHVTSRNVTSDDSRTTIPPTAVTGNSLQCIQLPGNTHPTYLFIMKMVYAAHKNRNA